MTEREDDMPTIPIEHAGAVPPKKPTGSGGSGDSAHPPE